MVKPLCIDLYSGLGGWTEGFLAEGWRVIGYDINPQPLYRGDVFMQQDVLMLHGSQFKDADMIVGSSPCQEFSYRAMPFKRGKMLGPPELGMKLFEAQFRIQREASEAAGRSIPMVVENVRGAQPWVGRAAWHHGSRYLWGDVPILMPIRSDNADKKYGGDCRSRIWKNRTIPRLALRNSTSAKDRAQDRAEIAKIPFALASYIARVYRP